MNAQDSVTEQMVVAASADVALRVTPAELRGNITHIEMVKHTTLSGKVLRWAVLNTKSGYAVTGRPSACVSPANDNEEIGEKVATENAMQELWPLMGYALQERAGK